jgi:lipid-A-disaccharide synthase
VAYKMSALSYAIISRMVKSPYISLPNLLAGEELVPEILQDQVRPDILGPLLLAQLQHSAERSALQQRFSQIHRSLRQNASERAADILLNMIEQRRLQVPVFE